jgi:hypothetical protein
MWYEINEEFRKLADDPEHYQTPNDSTLSKYIIAMGGSMAVCWKTKLPDGRTERHGLMIARDEEGFDPQRYRETLEEQEMLLDDWIEGGNKMKRFRHVLVEGPD